jgi:acyl dehydratase
VADLRVFSSYEELTAALGEHLGYSDWLTIDQERIDTFAAATGDHQWIHVDPQRAAAGPFGTTVAHGYLTLSLVPLLVASLVDYAGWSVKINYGSNKVRFPSPVRVDSRVRAAVRLADVARAPGGTRVTLDVVLEVDDGGGQPQARPALAAEIVTLLA